MSILVFSGLALAGPPIVTRAPDAGITVDPDRATVVFIRPSAGARAVKPAIVDETGRVVAEVRVDSWVAATLEPGPHTLVSWGEGTPTMKVDLEAGEIYYVKVAFKMGAWSARMVLEAMGPTRPQWEEVPRWTSTDTRGWVIDPEVASAYATLRKADIAVVLAKGEAQWSGYSEEERAARSLTPDDGVTSPVR